MRIFLKYKRVVTRGVLLMATLFCTAALATNGRGEIETDKKAPGAIMKAAHSDVRNAAGLKLAQFRPRNRAPKIIDKAVRRNTRKIVRPTLVVRSRFTGEMTAVDVSRDGRFLATAGKNGAARIWSLDNGQKIMDLRLDGIPVLSVAFIPGKKLLAVGGENGAASIWNFMTGEKVHELKGRSGPIHSLASSRDGGSLASGGEDGGANVWYVDSGRLVRGFKGNGPFKMSVALNPAGDKLFTGGSDGRVHVWDALNGANATPLGDSGMPVTSMTVSSDGAYLAAGRKDGVVTVWKMSDKEMLFSGPVGKHPVLSVAISPDGAFLAINGGDKTAALISLESKRELRRFIGHSGDVNAVEFVKSGKYVITASADHTVRVWDPQTGKELCRLATMRRGWAAVSPEGFFDGNLSGDEEDRLDAIRWEVDKRSFPLDGFIERYYQPALLGRILAGKAPEMDKKAPEISEGFHLPPVVRITSPASDSRYKKRTLKVVVECVDQGGGVDGIRLYHNGKRLSNDDARQPLFGNKKKKLFKARASLVDGKNVFRAVGLSKDRIESEPVEITVEYDGKDDLPDPVLHVFVVGVDKYKNKDLNLDFCVADAKAVLDSFSSARKSPFKKRETYELYDEKATREGIYDLLKGLEKVPAQDSVVLFFAGHGETSGDTWYFVPYELESLENKKLLEKKGVSSRKLKEYIKKIGAKHIFLSLDACKSGAAYNEYDEYDDQRRLALLSHYAGIHIAAAAGKEQRAAELRLYGHGLFTYVLLKGLRGEADIKPPDGGIWVKETMDYIRQEMPNVIKECNLRQDCNLDPQRPVLNSRGENFILSLSLEK